LAPDVYLAVVPVTGTADAPRLDGGGEAIEYAVKMRRFSQEGLLAAHPDLLDEAGALVLAERLVAFHRDIAVAEAGSRFGRPETVAFPMRQNFAQIRGLVDDPVALERLGPIEAWTEARYAELQGVLAERKTGGYVRECHGDLHLGNIAREADGLIIFDGIEFNPDLCWIDTMSELAFLLMDMEEKGLRALAWRLLDRYLELSGDYAGVRLLRFYQVYRAMVRAKVSVIRLGQPSIGEEERAAILATFSAYLEIAERYMEAGAPALLITHGLSGSGKSTGTTPLIPALPALRLRSDVERKRLAGLDGLASSGSGLDQGIYTGDFSSRTYARLLALAETILRAGFSVVVDATFLRQVQREPFRQLAASLGVPFAILDFPVPDAELRQRVEERIRRGGDPSEATVEVLECQMESREPLSEEEQASVVDMTDCSIENLRDRMISD
jgi:aminoglycoside phosphotransferase family enzyme/predicted kinase